MNKPEEIRVEYHGDKTIVLQGGTALLFGGNAKETPLDAALAALRMLLQKTSKVVFDNWSDEDVRDRINAVFHEFGRNPHDL